MQFLMRLKYSKNLEQLIENNLYWLLYSLFYKKEPNTAYTLSWHLGCCYLKVWSLFSACIFENMMNNYTWTLIIWWKRKLFVYFVKCYLILNDVFSFKIYFSFSFCSDFNLEATVVKTDKIRGFKQLFMPCFLLIGKNIFYQSN